MPLDILEKIALETIKSLSESGLLKGEPPVIMSVKRPSGEKGPRYLLAGMGETEFIKMNSNSYLGMALRSDVIEAEERAAQRFGTGPAAVRFIHGTYESHAELEKALSEFHDKEACMLFSSAYSANCGVLGPLISKETVVLSDELNHNSIINAIRLSKPHEKFIYPHLDFDNLKNKITHWIGKCKRIMIVTDGIFSMRGDYPDLKKLVKLSETYTSSFEEGVITVVDDSHGVGSLGRTGRGTIEETNAPGIDIITSTLGKALGVNGGYIVTKSSIIEYLRETSPLYIYSNPITPAEAAAALKALEILDSNEGLKLLKKLHNNTLYFKNGLSDLGFETMPGNHPIVPVMIRNKTLVTDIVKYLAGRGVLAVGIKPPIVPEGEENLRFQVSASHTTLDLGQVLDALAEWKKRNDCFFENAELTN